MSRAINQVVGWAARPVVLSSVMVACGSPGSIVQDNPLPVLSAVAPTSLGVGATDLNLVLNGSGFVAGTRARWNGADRATTLLSPTQLKVRLLAEDVRTGGYNSLDVMNPPPGGGVSAKITVPVEYPVPVLDDVSPDSAGVWAAVTVTVTGRGFVEGSVLSLDNNEIAIAGARTDRLIASFQAGRPGVSRWTVTNPTPGGGVSNAIDFVVEYRTPTITSLEPGRAWAVSAFDLLVRGTNFGPGTVIRFNGVDRPTTVLAHDAALVRVRAVDIPAATNLAVTAWNPSPGGESAPVALRVDPIPPTATSVFPSTVLAGTPGVRLTLFGRHFLPTSQVGWSNQPRPTTFIDSTRLEAEIPASDLAVPTLAYISVYGTPAAPTIGAVPFVVRDPDPRIRAQTIIEMENNNIAVDPGRNLIYASIPEHVVGFGNSILAFDAANGALLWSLVVGTQPGRLAVSGDGKWLYVLMQGEPTVVRVDLAERTVDLRIDLGLHGDVPIRGQDIAVLPSDSRSFLLATYYDGGGSVLVYDDAIPRAAMAGLIERLAPSNVPLRYYASGGDHSFFVIEVTTSGVTLATTGYYSPWFGGAVAFADGKLFSTSGDVVDVSQLKLLKTLPASTSLAVDPVRNRVFHVRESTLTVYDVASLTAVDSLNIGFGGNSRQTLPLGADGLVFHNEARITVIRSSVVSP